MRSAMLLSLAMIALAFSSSGVRAAAWPQWRGPGGQGVAVEKGFPVEWSAEKNIAWKRAVPGTGHSSPVVWGDRIFLTTAIEGAVIPGAKAVEHKLGVDDFIHPDSVGADRSHELRVICLHRDSGAVLWEKTVYEGRVYDARHSRGSFASPTPATDGERVYSYFGSEGVYSHDFDGRELWKASVGGIATLGMGVASSPVLFEDLLVLQCDEDNGEKSFICALDAATGKEVWRAPRRVSVSWTTPIVIQAAGRAELIASGNERIVAYAPRTGAELWHTTGLESNAIHTPMSGNGLLVFSAGYPAKRVLALRPGGSGESGDLLWKYGKGTGYVPSPILYEGRVYLLSDRGVMTCLDAVSGKVEYDAGRLDKPVRFMASPVAYEGKILLAADDGSCFLIKAGTTHEVLGTSSIGEPIFASPALSEGRIFLRGTQHVYCIRNPV